MTENKAIIKFNSGNLALLCSSCSVIIKVGYEFNDEEKQFAKGELDYLPPLYCNKCKENERKRESRTTI